MRRAAYASRGKIPAVVYGAAEPAVAMEVDPKQIQKILHSESGHNSIFDLEISGSTAKTKAMIVDWQYEPIKGKLMHIDLKRIAMDKAMRVEVPIQLTGIAIGVKTQGGILDQVLREVEIECLPGDIPGHIDVDVSNMAFGDVLRVSDLPHSDKLKFLTDEDATVAHVVAIKEEGCAGMRSSGGCGNACRAGSGEEGQAGDCGSAAAAGKGREEVSLATAEAAGRSGVLLVVGLGNPGIEYQFTPHNAGFLAIDRIADDHGAAVANRRCRALTAKVQIAGREVILAKPETFMNLSGLSVAALAEEFEVDPAAICWFCTTNWICPGRDARKRARQRRQGITERDPSPARCDRTSGRASGSELARTASREDAFRRGKDYLLTPMRKAGFGDDRRGARPGGAGSGSGRGEGNRRPR